eukprot:6184133-Pleurochrysis_carterae.AAC.1
MEAHSRSLNSANFAMHHFSITCTEFLHTYWTSVYMRSQRPAKFTPEPARADSVRLVGNIPDACQPQARNVDRS